MRKYERTAGDVTLQQISTKSSAVVITVLVSGTEFDGMHIVIIGHVEDNQTCKWLKVVWLKQHFRDLFQNSGSVFCTRLTRLQETPLCYTSPSGPLVALWVYFVLMFCRSVLFSSGVSCFIDLCHPLCRITLPVSSTSPTSTVVCLLTHDLSDSCLAFCSDFVS